MKICIFICGIGLVLWWIVKTGSWTHCTVGSGWILFMQLHGILGLGGTKLFTAIMYFVGALVRPYCKVRITSKIGIS